MAKRIISVSVDELGYRGYLSINSGERSELVNKFLTNLLETQNVNNELINPEKLKVEIESLEREKFKIVENLHEKRRLEDEIKQKSEDESLRKIEEERIRNEQKKRCINCGDELAVLEKKHQFNKGLTCDNCFLGASPEDIERWS